jgi:tocopherol O-methyltransferase
MSAAADHGSRRERVRAYYVRKTDSILAKYGPGPRVHFHTGLLDPEHLAATRADAGDADALRRHLVASQERLLDDCAKAWDAPRHLSGRVLDVGCGLGGGAIYWAQEYGAPVAALTDVPAHVPWIRKLSLAAGASRRVRPVVADACAFAPSEPFDAAIAIESSCYFDRDAWFAALARQVRPGGRVFVVDSFRVDPNATDAFDAYWLCRLGTLDEYGVAAARHGFVLKGEAELTRRAAGFWEASVLYARARHRAERDARARTPLERSITAHERFRAAFATGAIRDRRLVFERAG